jgi:hypothetical protein
MSHATAHPTRPLEPVTAVCAAMYYADLVPAYAFVFRVASTDSRFTVYTADVDRYLIGATYTLTLAEPDHTPLWLSSEEREFLRHCLHVVEQRWHEAVAEADAGAERPQPDTKPAAAPGHVNVEPTPAGYRAVAQAFRDELERVQHLARWLDHPSHGDEEGDAS